MQMKIQVHKSLLVSFLFFFTQEQYEQLMRQLHECVSVQMTAGRIHSLRVGWRKFFSSCAAVSVFWFWREIGFSVTYLHTQSTIQLWRCVSFLVLVGNSVWCYILYVLSTQCTIQLCNCVNFFVVVGNSSQNENAF